MSLKTGLKLVPPAELVDTLRSRDNYLITTHVNPDGDAIGSAVALAMALESIGKKTVLLNKHKMPLQYTFMPGHEKFHTFETFQAAGLRAADFDTLLLVDCNNPERIGLENKEQHPAIEEMKRAVSGGIYSMVVDHHQTENAFGLMKWIVPGAAATGMMVYAVIKALGAEITEAIVKNIYTAIAVDTGNFRFDNTDAEVFRLAAELTERGAVPGEIYEELYESFSSGRFRLFLAVISTLEIIGDIAIVYVTKKLLEETATGADDTENFVSFARQMRDVRISILIRELGLHECKLSLRSKRDLNVAAVAASFNGGGHKNAAGCRIKADIETAKKMVLEKIRELSVS
jgi:bifunctional oligoribonuclease and PAP phosphatase NrnA